MRVPADEVESARARFLVLSPEGFEELKRGHAVELVAYTDARGEERIRHAFSSVRTTIVEPGWEERWRQFHSGVKVAGLWIGPPWEGPLADVPAVVVEPGGAFGTGGHPTTRACVELLARTGRGSLLDAGCGSGVLSLAALRLGFAPITAVDVDQAAVEATRANAARNGVVLDVRLLDVLREDLPTADLVVANLELAGVSALLGRWGGREAITSGYLAHEQPGTPRWSSEERVELDGWAAERFVRMG